MGLRPSETPTFQHCDNDHFLQRTWRTQARQNPAESRACPVQGAYSGHLPDAPGLCSRLASDCANRSVEAGVGL